MKYWI